MRPGPHTGVYRTDRPHAVLEAARARRLEVAAEYWADRGRTFLAVFVDPQRRLALPEFSGDA